MTEAAAVHPGDGEVQVPLSGEVVGEESGGQKLRVGFAMIRFRDMSEKNVAKKIQHDRKVGEPAEKHNESVVASIAADVRENPCLKIH